MTTLPPQALACVWAFCVCECLDAKITNLQNPIMRMGVHETDHRRRSAVVRWPVRSLITQGRVPFTWSITIHHSPLSIVNLLLLLHSKCEKIELCSHLVRIGKIRAQLKRSYWLQHLCAWTGTMSTTLIIHSNPTIVWTPQQTPVYIFLKMEVGIALNLPRAFLSHFPLSHFQATELSESHFREL